MQHQQRIRRLVAIYALVISNQLKAADLLEQALSLIVLREQFTTGYVVLSVEGENRLLDASGHNPVWKPYQYRYAIWFSGDRLRFDLISDGGAAVNCDNCLGKGVNLSYQAVELPQGAMAAVVQDLSQVNRVLTGYPDPKYLGILPYPIRMFNPQSQIAKFRSDLSQGTELRELSDHVLHWKADDRVEHTLSLSEDLQRIVILQKEYTHGEVKYLEKVSSEYSDLADGGPAYPSRVIFEQTVGDDLTIREQITVERAEFGPVAGDVFTLAGIQTLQPGTRIAWFAQQIAPPAPGALVWDGKQIIPADPQLASVADAPSRFSITSLILLNLLVWGIAIVIWKRSRREADTTARS